MIRKKKVKKRNRKNPHVDNAYIIRLGNAFIYASKSLLSDAIIYYNQGEICKDCDQSFEDCECEKCPECEFNRCMCNIGVFTEDIRKEIWEIAKKTLNDKQLLFFVGWIIKLFEDLNSKPKTFRMENLLYDLSVEKIFRKITKNQNDIQKLREIS